MSNLQSTLTIKLLDDVSGPAGKIAAALKNADTQVKALEKSGVSSRMAQQLSRFGASAAEIDKVGASWKKYAADQKLAVKSGDWTKTQTAQVRVWENATINSIRNVTRAEEALARRQRELSRPSMSPTGPKVAPPSARVEPWGPRQSKGPPAIVPVATDKAGGRALASGYATYQAAQFGRKVIASLAEFDIASRKQREFVDITKELQDDLLTPQAKRIGQDTQFTNVDVVRAQTKAMQGLPATYDAKLKAEVGAAIVENVKNYALVMEANLETSAEAIRTFLQTTNKDISTKEKAVAEATRATNLMVKMAKLGGMNDEDVQQYMKFGAATGTAAGLSDTSLAALGAIGRRGGLRGDELGVFIRAVASKLVSPNSKGLDALTAAGINFNNFSKMPGGLSVGNLESFQKRRFGKGFSDDQRERLSALLDNGEVVGSRDEFVQQVSAIVAESFDKTKGGKTKAQDAQKIAKMVGDFYKLSIESVDTEGLLNEIMSNPKMGIALLNALVTSQHGGRAEIVATKWDEFKAIVQQLRGVEGDPDFAKRKADEIMAGIGGAFERAKGSIENFQLSIGQANEQLAKLSLTKFGDTLDAISNLPEPVRRVGTEMAALAVGIGALKGFEALTGGFGLNASAKALDGSAALLNAAAERLGRGGTGSASGAVVGGSPASKGLKVPSIVPLPGLPGPLVTVGAVLAGKELMDFAFPQLPHPKYPKGYDPENELHKAPWTRAGELIGRWRSSKRGGEGYGKDFTLGSQGKFTLGPSYVPPGGFKSFSAWNGKNVAPGPLGSDRGAMDGVWSAGTKGIKYLDQSSAAGQAGEATGSSYRSALASELQAAEQDIRSFVQRATGMLGFTARPHISPQIDAPAGGAQRSSVDGVSRALGRRTQEAMYRNFSDMDFG